MRKNLRKALLKTSAGQAITEEQYPTNFERVEKILNKNREENDTNQIDSTIGVSDIAVENRGQEVPDQVPNT